MNHYLEKGKEILKTLKRNGYEAYFVGGYVRDVLIGIPSKDIDITTSASPDEVISLFNNVKKTGKKYGSVTVLKGDFKYEVTTYRSDGTYLDNRRPDSVTYEKNITEDIKRRDFTINAILMDENEQIIDYLNGKADIENKLIRTINNPTERFTEDSLRMLRAFRFVSKLGFDIETQTLQAIQANKSLIQNIAIERVMIELSNIIKGPYRNKALQYMIQTGFTKELYGLEKGLTFISNRSEKLYPIEAFIISFILDDMDDIWKFSNKERWLIKQVMDLHEVTKEDAFNKFIVYVNKEDVCLVVNKINTILGYPDQEALIKDLNAALPIKDVCDLTFKGQDILWLTNMRKKSWIGRIVDDLKYNVIMGNLPNEYEVLKEYALQKVEELNKEMGVQDE